MQHGRYIAHKFESGWEVGVIKAFDKDIWLVCAKPACSRTWTWTPGSQAFYKSVDKGTPKYCPGCRN